MPVKKGSLQTGNLLTTLRVSGLFIRRRSDREFHSYIPLLKYDPDDYEVLLRFWGSEPFSQHLGAFSGPMIAGEDPEQTLLLRISDWTKKLANKAGKIDYEPLKCHKAVFLSMHGGGRKVDPESGELLNIGIILCYIMPIKQRDSLVISQFPSSPEYPKFYSLGGILHQMVRNAIKIHPYTREMLSSLDHWLREQHAVSGSINTLFAPSLKSRIKMFFLNPLFAQTPPRDQITLETPNQSFIKGATPLISSTPFNGIKEENTSGETTVYAASRSEERDTSTVHKYEPVDMIVKNPLFGSGLSLKKVDMIADNKYFGCGEPNYSALGNSKGKWMVQVQDNGLQDWTERFPLHKFSCEGNVEGVMKCIQLGMSADESDTDTWSPLHYACWYGELEVVKVLVEKASVTIGIRNNFGSTPLHLAAGTGHAAVVSYLLKQREGQNIKTALDNDGKSPLAVCLECRMNNWSMTAQILRDAYKNPTPDNLSSPSLIPSHSPPSSSMEDQTLEEQLDLSLKGSLGNLYVATHQKSQKKTKKKSKSPEQKPARTIRRQRVNLGIGQHQVAHFFNGRETNSRDVIMNLYRLIRLPRNFHSLFSLWIASNSLELQLGDTDQPLKLMYSWKKLLSQYGSASTSGKKEEELPTFHLWRNVFSPPSAEMKISDPLVLEFLYADAQRRVVNSQYPCSEEDVIYLAGITLQITYGDYNESVHSSGFLKGKWDHVLPGHMMASSKRKLEFQRRVLAKYAEISQFGFEDMKFLYKTYLKHCWKWPHYGATFYEGILHMKEAKIEIKGRVCQLPVLIGINTGGFHLINSEKNTLITSVAFDGLDWDVSTAKHELIIFNKDRTIYIPIYSKKASLLYSLATRMREQYAESNNQAVF